MAAAGTHTGLVLAGLLFSVAVLVAAARVLSVPYPIFLVVGGLGLGLIPGIPDVELDPDLVLLVFLPPLLYSASYFTGLRELRQNIRPISLLAVGLVLATALVAHALIDGMSWPAAFALGAIVSPTDPVAATAIAGRLGVPRRVVTIVEGQALINRRNRFAARFDDEIDDGAIEERSTAWGRMMFAVIDTQRDAIEGMRRSGEITDEVGRSLERDLDLEESRLSEVRQ